MEQVSAAPLGGKSAACRRHTALDSQREHGLCRHLCPHTCSAWCLAASSACRCCTSSVRSLCKVVTDRKGTRGSGGAPYISWQEP